MNDWDDVIARAYRSAGVFFPSRRLKRYPMTSRPHPSMTSKRGSVPAFTTSDTPVMIELNRGNRNTIYVCDADSMPRV